MDINVGLAGGHGPGSRELGFDIGRGYVDSSGAGEDVDPNVVRLGDDDDDPDDADEGDDSDEHHLEVVFAVRSLTDK